MRTNTIQDVKNYLEYLALHVLHDTLKIEDDPNEASGVSDMPGIFVNGTLYIYEAEIEIQPTHLCASVKVPGFCVSTIVSHPGNRHEPPSEDYVDEIEIQYAAQVAEEVIRRLVQIEMSNHLTNLGEYQMFLTEEEKKEQHVKHVVTVDVRVYKNDIDGFDRKVEHYKGWFNMSPSKRMAVAKYKRLVKAVRSITG